MIKFCYGANLKNLEKKDVGLLPRAVGCVFRNINGKIMLTK